MHSNEEILAPETYTFLVSAERHHFLRSGSDHHILRSSHFRSTNSPTCKIADQQATESRSDRSLLAGSVYDSLFHHEDGTDLYHYKEQQLDHACALGDDRDERRGEYLFIYSQRSSPLTQHRSSSPVSRP